MTGVANTNTKDILFYSVQTGCWVGDCFIYTNASHRLNYLVGEQTQTIAHFDNAMYLLGYIPRDNRLYLVDKDVNIVSYGISLTVIEYQTAVLRGDMETAETLLPRVPHDQLNKIARFLEAQDLKEDLERAGIRPWAWVINNSIAAARPQAPFLRLRAASEAGQIERVSALAGRIALVPLRATEPTGEEHLAALAAPGHQPA